MYVNHIIRFIVSLILAGFVTLAFSQTPFDKKKKKEIAFESIRLGEIKPDGWLKQTLEMDLEGLVGNLDRSAYL